MLLELPSLIRKYNMNITGVIQVGAHHGQEVQLYTKLHIAPIILIEPARRAFNFLEAKYGDSYPLIRLFNCACADYEGESEMFIETHNQGMSNSLLEPARHLQQYPDIAFDGGKEKVKVRKLDGLEFDRQQFNFLNMDVQCAEMLVLKGAVQTLENIDYIISEVNNVGAELYKGCTDIVEMDKFLDELGFIRPENPSWIGGTWSDAFWLRKKFLML